MKNVIWRTVRHMAEMKSEALAAEIRAEVARQRRTTTDLATEIGMSGAALGRRLRGEHPFDVTELEQIARALGISVTDLWARAS